MFFLYFGFAQTVAVLAQNHDTKLSAAEITFVFVSKKVEGHISGFRSSSTIDLEAIETSVFKGSVETKTLKTGIFLRDWSLRGEKDFNTDDYPKIAFESTSVTANADGFSPEGHLTVKGTNKPVNIDFVKKSGQLIGATTLFSSDFGIDIKDDQKDNKVDIKIVFTLGEADYGRFVRRFFRRVATVIILSLWMIRLFLYGRPCTKIPHKVG